MDSVPSPFGLTFEMGAQILYKSNNLDDNSQWHIEGFHPNWLALRKM
jgi:hypothetical protein